MGNAAAIIASTARVAPVMAYHLQSGQAVDHENSFALTAADTAYDVSWWVPRAGHLTILLHDGMPSWGLGPVVRAVTVCPGEYREYDVVAGNGLHIGETRTPGAAFAIALEWLMAPTVATAQHDHDPFAV